MTQLNKFSNLYLLSKTLRFELKPIGKTLEHIERSGVLTQDQHRAESYVEVKKIIDEYHKVFIEKVLEKFKFSDNKGEKNSLEEYFFYYMCKSKDKVQKDLFEEIQGKLRKQIANSFIADECFKRLDKKELIKEDLISFVINEEERKLVEEFSNFTTYFTGFYENRKNMYSPEANSTAIAYRLIHENLPKFIDNIMVFDKVAASPIVEHFAELYGNF